MSNRRGAGFSKRIKEPEFQKLSSPKVNKKLIIFLCIAVIGFVVFTALAITGRIEWATALICSGVIGLICSVFLFLQKDSVEVSVHENAHLVKKKAYRKKDAKSDKDIVYLLVFSLENGGEKKLNVSNHKSLFKYYEEGDIVRFHPGFPYPEKYEKIFDNRIICVSCGKLNPTESDRCTGCSLLLLK